MEGKEERGKKELDIEVDCREKTKDLNHFDFEDCYDIIIYILRVERYFN